MANRSQYSFLEDPMNSMEGQKVITPEDEPPRSVCVQYAKEKSREIAPERMKRLGQSGNEAQLWMSRVLKVKYDAVKKNVA